MSAELELLLELEGTAEQYELAYQRIGINAGTGAGIWPQGLASHSAGITTAGTILLIERWESKELHADFMAERFTAALKEAGIPETPISVMWLDLLTHLHVGN